MRSSAARISSRLSVGGWMTEAVAANETTARRVLRGRDAAPRGLRRRYAGGRYVGRPHAARSIDGKDHRLILVWKRDDRSGSRDGDDHRDQRQEKNQRRNNAPELPRGTPGFLHHGEA